MAMESINKILDSILTYNTYLALIEPFLVNKLADCQHLSTEYIRYFSGKQVYYSKN